jgi:uncharacterized membrane protein
MVPKKRDSQGEQGKGLGVDDMNLTRRFKGYFLHGLAVLLPTILTIWLFVWGYTFIQEKISVHINRGLVYVIARLAHESVEITDKEVRAYLLQVKPELSENEPELQIHMRRADIQRAARIEQIEKGLAKTWVDGPGSITGFLIALVGVCVLGALLASYVGKSLWRTVEQFIMNVPFVRKVFPYVKQFTDFLLTNEKDQKKLFSRVVAVEYPRRGIWSLGFVTGSGLREVVHVVRRELLTVFIPTSPSPLTGFVITVPKRQTIDLGMTIEEGFRLVVTGGVVAPGSEHAAAALPRPESPKGDSRHHD